MEFSMQIMWFIAFLVFLGLELLTSISLVSIWFCVGALGGFVAAILGAGFFAQIIVFAIISLALLYLTKPFLHKIVKVQYEPTNADRIIGATCIVQEEINNFSATGAIKFEGKTWTARSMHQDQVIPAGEKVSVYKIEGVTAFVNYIKEES